MPRRPIPVALALSGPLMAMLMAALDQTAPAPALPEIAGDLGGLDQMPVIVTAYPVATTAVMPVFGRLGDRAFALPAAVGFLLGFGLSGVLTHVPAFSRIAPGRSATRAGLLVTALMDLAFLIALALPQLPLRTTAHADPDRETPR
ncbi:hypothetical protein [Nocardiopsis sp. FIRDI 009]|uniref:hypothetical protein n=1 Tax=Nocardiopsis sp. FIRDI 009 TaxID=714197 RepID=UPI001E33848A|nr:hypothetical protein [Nocardiopsis sp. FIRDI 009]